MTADDSGTDEDSADGSSYDPEVTDAKAAAPGYAPQAFFFRQTSPSGATRLVAWPRNASSGEVVFRELVALMPTEVDVLYKADLQGTADGPVWTRYHGTVDRDGLLATLAAEKDLIFRDGYTQLCVRRDDTGEYIVFDEYGLIFVYSMDASLMPPLQRHLREQAEALISQIPHWRQRLPDTEAATSRFVERLALERVVDRDE